MKVGHSPYDAAKFFAKKNKTTYDPSNFRRWFANRDDIKNQSGARARVVGAGRKPLLGDMEECLFNEIVEMRVANVKVTRAFICDRAQQMAAEHELEFSASKQWITNFMQRNRLSLRRTTNFTLLKEEELVSRAINYMAFLMKVKLAYDPRRTLLMDETAVYLEDSRTITVDIRGRKHVIMKTTGFSSMRITVVASVWANGQRATPLVIHKGESTAIKSGNGILFTSQPKSWVDSQLIIKWLDHMFPLVDTSDGKTLIWDSCRAHISKDVKQHCLKRKIHMVVIPGGMTPYLQAGDIAIYKAFKDQIGSLINEWKNSNMVEYTRGGNPKPPKENVVNEWVKIAWRAIPSETIQNSVNAAGFAFNHRNWHIAKHDIYGAKFIERWEELHGAGINDPDSSVSDSEDDFYVIEENGSDEDE